MRFRRYGVLACGRLQLLPNNTKEQTADRSREGSNLAPLVRFRIAQFAGPARIGLAT